IADVEPHDSVEDIHVHGESDHTAAVAVLQRAADSPRRGAETAPDPVERVRLPGGSAREGAPPLADADRSAHGPDGTGAGGQQSISPQECRRRRVYAEAAVRHRMG